MAGESQPHPELTARRIVVGIALTAVAGYVDCFGYLTLSGVYTAQMSGNTVLVAVQAGRGDTPSALVHGYTIGVFVAGLLVSGIAIEAGLRLRIRRVLAMALAVETACLTAIAVWGVPQIKGASLGSADAPNWPLYVLIALTAIAMGTQNTSLRMAGILAVFTTHVTGSLTRFTEQFVTWLLPRSGSRPGAALRHAAFSGGLWLAFLAGAVAAAELLPRWGAGPVLIPAIAALLVVIAADLIWPFAELPGATGDAGSG